MVSEYTRKAAVRYDVERLLGPTLGSLVCDNPHKGYPLRYSRAHMLW